MTKNCGEKNCGEKNCGEKHEYKHGGNNDWAPPKNQLNAYLPPPKRL
jgi:hypothetical protein